MTVGRLIIAFWITMAFTFGSLLGVEVGRRSEEPKYPRTQVREFPGNIEVYPVDGTPCFVAIRRDSLLGIPDVEFKGFACSERCQTPGVPVGQGGYGHITTDNMTSAE